MELAVQTDGLTKTFRSFRGLRGLLSPRGGVKLVRETKALDGLDLRVPRGSVYGLLGRNGAGKTTTIQLLMGLLEPTAGRCEVLGFDPVVDEYELKRRVGHVADGQRMYEFFTVEELCDFASTFYPSWNSALEAALLDRFEVPRERRLGELSRGTKAQVALVLALSHEPELLLMDESTSGLDAVIRRQFLESIVELSHDQGRTVVLSSHLIDDMERVCDWVGLIHKGKLLLQAPVQQLKDQVKEVRATFSQTPPAVPCDLGDALLRSETYENELVLTAVDFERTMISKLKAAGARTVEVIDLTLEEIFVAYTTAPPVTEC